MRTKRGRCNCGAILEFAKSPIGYKTRCVSCGAVVRLQLQRHRRKKKRPPAQTSIPVIERDPLAMIEEMADVDEESQSEAPAPPPLPSRESDSLLTLEMVEMEPWDAEPPPSGAGKIIVAVVLGSLVVIGAIVGAIWFFDR